jgi:hypothetical protein
VWGNDVVKITVKFAASGPDRQLTDLTAVVGSDKYSWDVLHAGAVRNINLLPGPSRRPAVAVLLHLDGRQRFWDGPSSTPAPGMKSRSRSTATARSRPATVSSPAR